ERLQYRLSRDLRADAGHRAMLDIDGSSDRDLARIAIGLKRMKCRCLHEMNHVGSGVNRRKFGMSRGEGMAEFLCFASLTPRTERNRSSHARNLNAALGENQSARAIRHCREPWVRWRN